MLLTVASEFLESTTNFAARLARHRGSDSLDVKDLQLHLGESFIQSHARTISHPAIID